MITTSGQAFGSITKRRSRRGQPTEINYLKNKDKRMRFNNSQDPIYYVFDCIENRPVSVLAKEFVKDSFFDAINFVAKVVVNQ